MTLIRLGTAGYPADRARLGLPPEAPVYEWHFRTDGDRWAIRQCAVRQGDAWRLRLGIAEYAAAHPGCHYYTWNEPTYCWPIPSARKAAELHADLTQAVGASGIVLTPGFAQPELGNCWWGGDVTDTGPDGRAYPYAEAFLFWLRALGGVSLPIFQFHFYPDTRLDAGTFVADKPIGQLRDVVARVRGLQERYADLLAGAKLWLTEVGYIDVRAGGRYGSYGWLPAVRFMRALVEQVRDGLVDVACWFIPRSEACADPQAQTGGWPGYLVYSAQDPTGEAGGSFLCSPWWFTVRCAKDVGQGQPDTLTPLGDVWRQGAQQKRRWQIRLPIVRTR